MGKLSGPGKMVWPGGEVYHGEFRADHEDGIGAFITADGNVFCGEFHQGKGNGRCASRQAQTAKQTLPFIPIPHLPASRNFPPATFPPAAPAA